jgi:hypothetical protein
MTITTGMIVGVVGVVSGLLGIISVIFTLLRTNKKDSNDLARQSGAMFTDIGYIKSGIDDIKSEQRSQGDKIFDLSKKVTEVDISAKQAHKRLDTLEHRLDGD